MRNFVIVFVMLISIGSTAQKNLPALRLKSMKGNLMDLNNSSEKQPLIISFWATWCEPCIKELNAFQKNLLYVEKDLNSKIVAVSIDDSRTSSRINPMINANSWGFEIFQDMNQDIKRALDIIDIPHTLVVYQNQILYEHTGYLTGDEEVLFEKILEIKRK